MSDESDQTLIRKTYSQLRGQYSGEDRRSERRQQPTDWIKELMPYVMGAAVIYAQFTVMQEKVDRLEKSTEAQWERIGNHLENHPQ